MQASFSFKIHLPNVGAPAGSRQERRAKKVRQNQDGTWLMEFEGGQTMDSVREEWVANAPEVHGSGKLACKIPTTAARALGGSSLFWEPRGFDRPMVGPVTDTF